MADKIKDNMAVDPPTGTKRKATEDPQDPPMPKRILALEASVVNRIAAGEIIISPVNALKELVENSIDAESTIIEVVVKDGGLKLLQITDNGTGIAVDDLPILCVRHTTSKLSDFDELATISSYGFRGEALASISHIAHLAVTTRTRDSDVAWRAHYFDGELVPAKPGQSAEPKMVAGRPGTQFTIEDMFFNIPIRRKAFRSPGEEYNKIVDMLGRYAIHRDGIGFSCKKHGDAGSTLAIQAAASTIDRIRQIYGGAVANELVQFQVASDKWGFQADGWVTNANYHLKKTTFLLFVNHRLVESQNIKRALEQTYSTFLPKSGRPFIYLNLSIRPDNVDVNLHPTKRVVGLVHEDEITHLICEHIRGKLAEVDHSRTFATRQPLLAVAAAPVQRKKNKVGDEGHGTNDGGDDDDDDVVMAGEPSGPKRPRQYSNTLVRTDASSQKITSMFPMTLSPQAPDGAATNEGETLAPEEEEDLGLSAPEKVEYETRTRAAAPVGLISIAELKQEVRDTTHEGMTQMMEQHIFVGIVDEQRRLAAIQSGIILYLVDYGRACYEYLYQLGLSDFANFGIINFRPPLDVRELISMAAESRTPATSDGPDSPDRNNDDMVSQAVETLTAQREMLEEYFQLEITPTGELRTLPLLVRGYTPAMVKLPQFLLNLATRVDWTVEKPCLQQILHELAAFYVPEELPAMPGGGGGADAMRAEQVADEIKARRRNVRWAVEHVFFPAFKQRMLVGVEFAKRGIWEMANLKDMYRTFERC